ncbi:MAG: MutS-related protein [Actinomycetota bacterium]
MEPAISLLHPLGGQVDVPTTAPASVADLALDRVLATLLAGRAEYHLEEWFWAPLRTADAVEYRQEAMRDLQRPEVGDAVRDFSEGVGRVRHALANVAGFRHAVQRRATFLDAATTWVATVQRFAATLAGAHPTSRALGGLAGSVAEVVASADFVALAADSAKTRAAVDSIVYRLHVAGDRVEVSRASGAEGDYSAEIEAVFDRFRQGSVRSYVDHVSERAGMDHIEEAVADRVAGLYPRQFALLERFAAEHRGFVDPSLLAAERELQFHLVGLAFAERLRASGLPVCWPEVSTDRTLDLVGAHDPALAIQRPSHPLVANDLRLADEQVAVVTGPNQGGKTTFARMAGAIVHLAALGLPVPAERARIPLPDRVLTHFGRTEDLADQRGALEDDLVRLREILSSATPRSLLVLNEVFASTTVADAVQLSRATLERILALGCGCIWVTFLTELAEVPGVVSLVSQVDPADPSVRTFRVVQQAAGGPTWAEALAVAEGLDPETLRRRLAR